MSTPLRAGVPRRATISDVAREAGTGKTSISRYLNGELSVLSPELRARIEAAIERLDYQPNQMARGLKRGRNRLIGMLLADLTNPYSVEVLQGVEAACHALGYMPLICHAANEVEMERRYLQLLTTYRVEGVIVNALGVREETLRPVGGGGIPAVLVDRSVEGLVADMVGLDNAEAARLGTRHLMERGFDDITFVVQPFEHVSSRRLREAAFREEIAQAATRARGKTVVLDLADDAAVEHTLAALDRDIDAAASEGAAGKRIAWFAANAPVALRVALHLNTRYGARWQERLALLC
jgi:LacI family transcriptional regulator, kdg operon repressor